MPFDYVLQLRFEVFGNARARKVDTLSFAQDMARHGMIANEYVGVYDESKHCTPITMQMMISQQAFKKLESVKSKYPIKPLKDEKKIAPHSYLTVRDIPNEIHAFITQYLAQKALGGEKINKKSLTISVNEAPATYANQVITYYQGIPVFLAGDAALGLSYFKGLNAGLEASAKFFTLFADTFKNKELTPHNTQQDFFNYQQWFSKNFAPRKVREVEQYSTWQIRSLMSIMKSVRFIKNSSMIEDLDDYNETIYDYIKVEPSFTQNQNTLYPHRNYPLVKFAQLSYILIEHSFKKINKMFIDYSKPYKSSYDVIHDFKQPLVGIANCTIGLGKLVVGSCSLNKNRVKDGSALFLEGCLEIITTPFAWIIKPLSRFTITMKNGNPKIETMQSMSKLADNALSKINNNLINDNNQKYLLFALANDLHRKFAKAYKRGQNSDVAMEEIKQYNKLRHYLNKIDERPEKIPKLTKYFYLFKQAAPQLLTSDQLSNDNNCKKVK